MSRNAGFLLEWEEGGLRQAWARMMEKHVPCPAGLPWLEEHDEGGVWGAQASRGRARRKHRAEWKATCHPVHGWQERVYVIAQRKTWMSGSTHKITGWIPGARAEEMLDNSHPVFLPLWLGQIVTSLTRRATSMQCGPWQKAKKFLWEMGSLCCWWQI